MNAHRVNNCLKFFFMVMNIVWDECMLLAISRLLIAFQKRTTGKKYFMRAILPLQFSLLSQK